MNDPKALTSLLIVGASARAAAESARRGGITPSAVDLFADEDLLRAAEQVATISNAEFPQELPAVCRKFPPMPWMYVGGLENAPEVVAAIAAERPLLGNDAAVLRRVRDLNFVTGLARAAGMEVPSTRQEITTSEDYVSDWLVKSQKSAGGLQVRRATFLANKTLAAGEYFQQFIPGEACSGAFVADGNHCRLMGFTRQLCGEVYGAPRPFQYAGSIGPITLPAAAAEPLYLFAQRLTAATCLRGVFGIDFILDAAQRPWFLEVNPRFTAGMEVFEQSGAIASVVDWHCRASVGAMPAEELLPSVFAKTSGKLILYAPSPGQLPRDWRQRVECAPAVSWADVPVEGGAFRAGDPVVTVRCDGRQAEDVASSLLAARKAWLKVFQPECSSFKEQHHA